jgi:hypothetical protein
MYHNMTFPHSTLVYSVWFSKQTAIVYLTGFSWLWRRNVSCEVRTEFLNNVYINFGVQRLKYFRYSELELVCKRSNITSDDRSSIFVAPEPSVISLVPPFNGNEGVSI